MKIFDLHLILVFGMLISSSFAVTGSQAVVGSPIAVPDDGISGKNVSMGLSTGADSFSSSQSDTFTGSYVDSLNHSYSFYRPNVLRNGDFDSTNSYGEPSEWFSSSTGLIRGGQSSDDFLSGSKSLEFNITGGVSDAQLSASHYPSDLLYLDDDLMFNIWIKVSGTNRTLGNGYVYFQLSDGTNNYYFYHYFVSFTASSNSSSTYYFNSTILMDSWEKVVIDLKQMATDTIGLLPGLRIVQIRLYADSIPHPSEPRVIFFDDLSLSNSSYEHFPTGDFETDVAGFNIQEEDPGEIKTVDGIVSVRAGSLEGRRSSAAMTKFMSGTKSIWIHNETTLKIDYRYSGTNVSNEYSYIYMQFVNGSYTINYYFYLGKSSAYSISSNNTYSVTAFRYVYVPHSGGWQQLEINLYELISSFNTTTMSLTYLQLASDTYSTTGVTEAKLEINSILLFTDPIPDNGFENTWLNGIGGLTNGWGMSTYPSANRSEDSFEGKYSAYLSSATGNAYAYRLMDVEINEKNVYTDFQVKLLNRTISGSSYAFISLHFDSVGCIFYVIAYNLSSTPFTNSSTATYFLLDLELNSWNSIVRNLENDMLVSFGRSDLVVDEVYVYIVDSGADRIDLLVDSLNFIQDDVGPDLESLNAPSSIQYYETPEWNLVVDDELANVSHVWMVHHIGGEWMTMFATFNGSIYSAQAPKYPFGTEVTYYFGANDSNGNIAIFNSSSYQYTVDDDVPPTVSMSLANNSVVNGNLEIPVTATDAGSNISSVSLLVDGTENSIATNESHKFVLDTRRLSNGNHTIQAKAVDNAGKEATSAAAIVIVDNDLEGPTISPPFVKPSPPTAGAPITIVVSVIDNSNVSAVTLHHRVSGESWQTTPMTAQLSLYNATLPSISVGQVLEFYISAIDVFNQTSFSGSESNPYIYSLETTDSLPLLESYLQLANEYYQQYEFFAGGLAAISLLMLLRTAFSKLRRGKKK